MRPLLDDAEDAVRGLLDRQLGDVDDGALEPPVELLGLVELLVDLGQLGVLAVAAGAPIARTRARRISARRFGSIVRPTIFDWSTAKSSFGGAIPFTTGTFAALWPR